tara:strand:+ start:192 stop:1337 length:1146 start_codon:yes stop_codon:yes gene_type:complete
MLGRRCAAALARSTRLHYYSTAPDAFSALEHKMWQAGADAYASTFGKVTAQATNELMDAAGVHLTKAMAVSIVEKTPLESREAGLRVLDVATGPGMIADAVAARGHAEVVALDFSPEMLRVAQSVVDKHPDGCVKLLEGDASALKLPDNSFDAVIIGFGLLHLPKPQLALAEAFRVLKPGGMLSYSVWEEPARGNLAFEILLDALAAHGSKEASLPATADGEPLPFFHFASAEKATPMLVEAGFKKESVRFSVVPTAASLRNEDELFEMFATATARSRALLEQQSDAQLGAIKGAMAAKITKHFSGTWQGRLGADGTWDATNAMHAGGRAHEYPGAEEKIHVVASFGSSLGGPAAGTQWMGGRFKHIVPMPAVIASAQKPF